MLTFTGCPFTKPHVPCVVAKRLTGCVNCNNYIISFSKPDSKRNFQNPSDKHIKIRYNKVNRLTNIGFFKEEMTMGVIQRFKDIMSANINAMLDKAENPEKMIDQYMRNLENDLGKVKAETASVMAEEARAKRAYDEALAEVEKYQKYAEKAVAAGNDNDARVFLQSKKTAQSKLEGLKLTYDTAAANAQKMRQMHDKLVNDISDLRARKETIKAKVAVAKAQERVNQVGSSLKGVSNNMSAFDRMEEKANKMLDTANAMAQLNESADTNVDDLARKYDLDDVAGTSDIDDELAALKAKLN